LLDSPTRELSATGRFEDFSRALVIERGSAYDCAVFRLLRNVRNVYKQWKALPPDQREQFASDIQRIRHLVTELGGSRALEFVESDLEEECDAAAEEPALSQRDRGAVIAELKEATSALMGKMAAPAGQLAIDSVPRSVRLSGRAMSVGVRRLGRTKRDT
jgi:hypothetical protein